jgi:hypothetical protein
MEQTDKDYKIHEDKGYLKEAADGFYVQRVYKISTGKVSPQRYAEIVLECIKYIEDKENVPAILDYTQMEDEGVFEIWLATKKPTTKEDYELEKANKDYERSRAALEKALLKIKQRQENQ